MRLANRARGDDNEDVASYVIWAEAEAGRSAPPWTPSPSSSRSDFPTRAALEMVPGATQQKVKRWMELRESEALDPVTQAIVNGVTGANGAGSGVGA
jgi:hypothetical protein